MRNDANVPDSLRIRDAYHADRPPVSEGRLWTGVLLAPASWLVMELLGYSIAARSCDPGRGIPLLGAASPAVMQAALALIFALLAVWGLFTAIGNWRAIDATGDEPPEWGRAQFMSFGGILTSALFLLGIVLFGLPPFLVNACSQAR